MLDLRISRNVLGVATLAAALTACGSDNPVGPGGSLDVSEVQAAQATIQDALEVPVIHSLLGDMSEVVLAPKGMMLDIDGARAQAALGGVSGASLQQAVRNVLTPAILANAVPAGERTEWYIDPALWTETYVKNSSGQFFRDPARTTAPTRGVRIALYERTAAGGHNNTIVGWLDVIDSSTATARIGRVNILSGNTTTTLVGTFRMTSDDPQAGTTTEAVNETFTGTLGVAPRTFTVADTITGTRTANGTNLRWHSVSRADFADVSYDFLVTGLDDETGAQGDAEVKIQIGDHQVRMDGSTTAGGDETSNVYIDNQLVAKYTYDADTETETITGPNGGPVSDDLEEYLIAAQGVIAVLPNGTIMHVVVGFMLAMI